MRLRILSVLIAAATLQLPMCSQQQAPAPADAPQGGAEQAAPKEHAVTPPKVSCKGNTLSISANYSALGAILTEVQKCMGVQFDAPEMARTSLVFDEIGPGPANDVLATLLTASGFDYIIGASATDPEKIEKVLLLARTEEKDGGGSPDMKGGSAGRKAFTQMREAARPHTPEEQQAAAAEMERSDTDLSASPQAGAGASDTDSAATKADGPNGKSVPNAATPDGQPSQNSADPAAPGKADAPPAANTDASASPVPPAQDSGSSSKPSSPNDDRIANMQQLFEQRRQMMQQQQQQTQHPPPQ